MSGALTPPLQPRIRPLGPDLGLVLADSPEVLRALATHPPGATFLCAHVGVSMNPALHHTDLLEVAPYGDHPPAPGDVILCVPSSARQTVVHRIVGADPDGIVTRGDNNPCDDAWRLRKKDIAGQVVAAWRGERRRLIPSGRAGQWQARRVRARRSLDRAVSPLLHPFYHALAGSGIVRHMLPRSARPRLLSFAGVTGPQWRLVFRRKVIGRYDAQAGRWAIRRPYRLLVDERALQAGGRMTVSGQLPTARAPDPSIHPDE